MLKAVHADWWHAVRATKVGEQGLPHGVCVVVRHGGGARGGMVSRSQVRRSGDGGARLCDKALL